ncbi:N-Acetylneuraminate cytidylyltransferase [Flavobacterium cauense R2A-7]|uniref:N-acylneuraminate cytidylyltransferase n=1 Tax=Flavobacterium cauense R2A-7 TaxID=1341154 RepID=V6S266_9FLAO|nr:acylneuraminate cytidylyltransferase family protein [Flavobacterium cauense]ESU20791.1 N-Acetylneuraminate cytidylyltransferase [Flavobacterium cauense R2A-7]KGO82840.1 acylneuraminate cytidylyltransferase [Flavobacterium cauense R2A-7]TWI12131.1 N-acylneuraminate cytidylyltransferase [Flavobacterium cauense R2A-7]
MRILAVIPARGGSKGVPGKNIKILGDKPLIAYSIESAKKSRLLSEIMVTTDDEAIAGVALQWGANIPFIRPKELAEDTTPTLAVIQHALEFYESRGDFFDAVCLLQPTSPFREDGFIDAAIAKFIESNADSLVSVLPVPHEYNPHWTFETNESGFLKIATGDEKLISRRQDLPKAYHRDGAVYIMKTDIVKQDSLYGKQLTYIESNPENYVNIDTLQDWEKATLLIKK